jgi:hypothetical protein
MRAKVGEWCWVGYVEVTGGVKSSDWGKLEVCELGDAREKIYNRADVVSAM